MDSLKLLLLHIFVPVKGIIYLELYLLVWLFWIAYYYFEFVGVAIIIIAATIYSVSVILERTQGLRSFAGRLVLTILGGILGCITLVLRAWIYLVYGILNGRVASSANQHLPISIVIHRSRFRIRRFHEDELPIHYRLGRLMYRTAFRLLTLIPWLKTHLTVVAVIARVICLVIALWGVWDIPRFMTE